MAARERARRGGDERGGGWGRGGGERGEGREGGRGERGQGREEASEISRGATSQVLGTVPSTDWMKYMSNRYLSTLYNYCTSR
jgi:hypothetical protein